MYLRGVGTTRAAAGIGRCAGNCTGIRATRSLYCDSAGRSVLCIDVLRDTKGFRGDVTVEYVGSGATIWVVCKS